MKDKDKKTELPQSLKTAVISCIHFLFKLINWNHFKQKHKNGKPYYTKIVKIKGFRTAVVDNIWGERANIRFYWTVGKYSL